MPERRPLRPPMDGSVTRPEAPGALSASPDVRGLHVVAMMTGLTEAPLLTVSVRPEAGDDRSAGMLVVAAAGEVDLDTVALLRTTLLDAVARHAVVCCDLSEVTFFSAVGVTALVNARDEAARRASRLLVRGPRGVTRRVLHICGLDNVVRGHRSAD